MVPKLGRLRLVVPAVIGSAVYAWRSERPACLPARLQFLLSAAVPVFLKLF